MRRSRGKCIWLLPHWPSKDQESSGIQEGGEMMAWFFAVNDGFSDVWRGWDEFGKSSYLFL
jgi:hypothetical protein